MISYKLRCNRNKNFFNCGLFNENSSLAQIMGPIASNYWMINELKIWRNVEGSDRDLIWGNVSVFPEGLGKYTRHLRRDSLPVSKFELRIYRIRSRTVVQTTTTFCNITITQRVGVSVRLETHIREAFGSHLGRATTQASSWPLQFINRLSS
jgi:hypothetical protein